MKKHEALARLRTNGTLAARGWPANALTKEELGQPLARAVAKMVRNSGTTRHSHLAPARFQAVMP